MQRAHLTVFAPPGAKCKKQTQAVSGTTGHRGGRGRAGVAGVEAELHLFEAMPHGDLLGEELFQPGDQQSQVEVHIRVAGPCWA